MFDYDYTFCTYKECKDRDCFRHPSVMPVGVRISMADLHEDPTCPNFGQVSDADTIIERMELLAPKEGDILCLFYNPELIDYDEIGELHSAITRAIDDKYTVLIIPTSMDVAAIDKATARELMEVFAAHGNQE